MTKNSLTSQAVRAAYLHWPFCQQKCAYCDFVSWPIQNNGDLRPSYVQCMLREIEAVGRWSHQEQIAVPLRSVFFGGGTPSLSAPDQLVCLLDALRVQFGLEGNAEVTFEANPGTVNPKDLSTLRQAGFNRISLGLQAAQNHLLQTLDRIHTYEQFAESVAAARSAGFERISVDLMLGLPSQTPADARESVSRVLDLGINHVSYYSLIIEPGTVFEDRYAKHPEELPDEDLERLLYHQVREQLSQAGLPSYEISNAAVPGEECRHNLVYWRGEPYYGFGVAAHSFLKGMRRGNTDSWAEYHRQYGTNAGRYQPFAATVQSEFIDSAEAEKEMLLLGLRLTEGVRWVDFSDRFYKDAREVFLPQISRLVSRGLVVTDERGIRLTETGLDLANQAFAEFV